VTNAFSDKIREVKDSDEIALMERAAEITDAAMEATIQQLRVGMTERDVAIEVDYQLRRHGGDKPSFYPGIICVGNGSDPSRHIMERNTEMVLAPGTTVAFDWGVSYQGYASDFGRSAFIGEPLPEALEAYKVIVDLNQTLMGEMKDGAISPAGIAARASEIMNAAGWGEHYMHLGLGHSIGLDVHENPWIRPGYDEPIRTNMCFTIEPKIWKPGVFYVRCEDVVVVGSSSSRPLTTFHYDPIVVS
jgi:Xaa-Pro dipeptidase